LSACALHGEARNQRKSLIAIGFTGWHRRCTSALRNALNLGLDPRALPTRA